MNLNKTLRTEQFDIDVDDEVSAFYAAWFDGLWDESGRSRDNRTIIKAVYDRFLENPEARDEPAGAAAAIRAMACSTPLLIPPIPSGLPPNRRA